MKFSSNKILVLGLGLILAAGAAFTQDVKPAHMHGQEMMGGDLLGRYADALDLTDAQQAQMKEIKTKEKPTMKPLMDQMFQSHKAMEQLVSSGAFDEAKVRAVAAQEAQAFQELAVQKARIDTEMMQILTPDQKTKLASIQQKHEQRFQKHSQESGQEPPPTE
jgi:Spy/CpxP family protein refolding chaperone